MKRPLAVLIAVGVIISITCGIVFAQQGSNEGDAFAQKIGAGLKNVVQSLISNKDNQKLNNIVPYTTDVAQDTVAVVMGDSISKDSLQRGT